jgi:hypothetical protein
VLGVCRAEAKRACWSEAGLRERCLLQTRQKGTAGGTIASRLPGRLNPYEQAANMPDAGDLVESLCQLIAEVAPSDHSESSTFLNPPRSIPTSLSVDRLFVNVTAHSFTNRPEIMPAPGPWSGSR